MKKDFTFYIFEHEKAVNDYNVVSAAGLYRNWICRIKFGKNQEYWATHEEHYNETSMQFENCRTKLVSKFDIKSKGQLKQVLEGECTRVNSLDYLVYPNEAPDDTQTANSENVSEISASFLCEKYKVALESRCFALLDPSNYPGNLDTVIRQLYTRPLKELCESFFMEGANKAFSLMLSDYKIRKSNPEDLSTDEFVAWFVDHYKSRCDKPKFQKEG